MATDDANSTPGRPTGGLIIEDDYDAEHRYDRPPTPALHSMIADQVCYAGSVSKLLAPALRVGWLVVPDRYREAIVAAKRETDLGNAVLTQLVLARMFDSGDMERHLRLVRRRHRRRRDAMVAAIGEHLPAARIHGAAAGLHLTITFPGGDSISDAESRHCRPGTPASRFIRCPGTGNDPAPAGLVLGYAASTASEIADGINTSRVSPGRQRDRDTARPASVAGDANIRATTITGPGDREPADADGLLARRHRRCADRPDFNSHAGHGRALTTAAPTGISHRRPPPPPPPPPTTTETQVSPIATPTRSSGAAPSPFGPVGLPGVNDPSCSSEQRPVVLLHGTFSTVKSNFAAMTPALQASGRCVFGIDYGSGGVRPVKESAAAVTAFVDEVLAATGADQVDVIAYSQGGLVLRTALRQDGLADKVAVAVLIAPSFHGSTSTLLNALPAGACPACADQIAGSALLTELDAGGDLDGDVRYAVVSSLNDTVVTPVASQVPAGSGRSGPVRSSSRINARARSSTTSRCRPTRV